MKLGATTYGGEQVRRELLRLGQSPRKALDRLAEEVEDYVEREAGKHSKSGALFASIGKRRTGPTGWIVGHDMQRAKHALFVHWGTKKHTIVPKGGGSYTSYKDIEGATVRKGIQKGGRGRKMLRFVGRNGKFAFARSVNHPGNKADPWFVRAASQAPLMFQRHIDAILRSRGT